MIMRNLDSLATASAGEAAIHGEIEPGGATEDVKVAGLGDKASASMMLGKGQEVSTGALLITSDVVAQGESFTGVIVSQTDSGTVPLDAGEKVVISGQVIDVKAGGEVDIPAIEQLGNVFVTPQR